MKTNNSEKKHLFSKGLIFAALAIATISLCASCKPKKANNGSDSSQCENSQPIVIPDDL